MKTLTRTDWLIALTTGVAIMFATLAIRYATNKINSKQEVRLLGQS